jgi:class 3 adenylate cyclase
MTGAGVKCVLVLPGGEKLPLSAAPLTVGRGQEATARFDDRRVSRLHASVEPAGHGYRVRDLDSTNGTFINGRRLKGRQLLASGDEIKAGDQSLYFLELTEKGLETATSHARAMLARREPGDRRRAEALLDHVEREAQGLNMAGVLEFVRDAKAAAADAGHTTIGAARAGTTTVGRVPLAFDLPARGRLTFLFTDIQDSTPLSDRLGDEDWMALLEVHHSIVRRVAASHSGHEVKSQGDGFMIVFREVDRGVQAACEMQRRLAEHNAGNADQSLLVRMGLHTGEVVREGDDFYGRNVVIATRVTASATGGEILVTDDVCAELKYGTVSESREVTLKGFDEPFRVHVVAWQAPGI